MAQVRQVAQIGTELQRDVLGLIFAGEGYLASGNADVKQRFTQRAGRTQDVVGRYRALQGLSSEEVQQVERLAASLTQLEVEFARAHALYDIGRRAEARQVADAVSPVAEEVAGLISVLGEQQALLVETSTAQLRSRTDARANYLLVILVFALGLGAALAYLTVRSIDRPLADLLSAADHLGEGHLQTRVGIEGMPREFASVGSAFNAMGKRMSSIASQVVATASQVSSSAAEFSAISEQVAGSTHEVAMAVSEISEGADKQASALTETAAAVVELRDGAARIESDANNNRELSHSIRQDAEHSQAWVRQALDLLLSLRGVVHSSAEEIEGLQAATDKITGFVRRISSIAEQTQLLSLNAAIEAAHAGHEGRGFSVVADEVGKLATEADAAAQEVEEVVGNLRERVGGAVVKMREGEGQLVQVEGVAHGAEDALDAISSGLKRVSEATDQALQTVDRSLVLLNQVAGNVESVTATASAHAARSQDVSAAVQEQTATTEEISASVSELVSAAEALRQLVGEWEV
jgi:methyl-accepting chemotaxis protein